MGKWLFLIAIACAACTAGCGSNGNPAAKLAVGSGGPGQFAVGQWSVTAIDGKPIPEGSSISLDYRPDGQLVVETAGKDAARPGSSGAQGRAQRVGASLNSEHDSQGRDLQIDRERQWPPGHNEAQVGND